MKSPSLISKILFSSPDFIIDKDKSWLSGLKKNQIFDAKVTRVLSDGKAVLKINGETVTAKTHVMLTPNETVRLQVIETGESKVLRLVPPESTTASPDGFQETRSFGRSGLFQELVSVLKQYGFQEKSGQAPELLKNQAQATKSPASTFLAETTLTATKKTGSPLKTISGIGFRPEDTELLKAFIKDEKTDLPFKTAVILTESKATAGIPRRVTDGLARQIFSLLSKGEEPQPDKPVIPQLAKRVQGIKAGLPAETLSIIDNLTGEKSSLTPGQTLFAVLTSGKAGTLRGQAVTIFQKFLMKNLENKGLLPLAEIVQSGPAAISHNPESRPGIFPEIKQMELLLDEIMLNPEKTPDGADLKTIIRNTGLMWEHKLKNQLEMIQEGRPGQSFEILAENDIKALAMRLSSVMEGRDENSARRLKIFVEGLEKMQVLNNRTFDDSGRFLLPLPFFSGENLKFGQLLIDLDREGDKQGKDTPKTVRVAFILEMSRLGHLRADFAVYKKSLSGVFGVENDEVRDHIEKMIPELSSNLTDKGYRVRKIECEVFSSGELQAASLTDMLTGSTEGLLNIVV